MLSYISCELWSIGAQGWTKTNAFHVCITSYKLVIQDHHAFRRKKWKYFILDEVLSCAVVFLYTLRVAISGMPRCDGLVCYILFASCYTLQCNFYLGHISVESACLSGSALVSVSEVTLRRAQFVLGLGDRLRHVSHLGFSPSHPGQLSLHPQRDGK